jgi:CAAX prenyl protease-like protein
MFNFIRKPYFILFIVVYVGALFVLYRSGYPTVHILTSLFCFALLLPLMSYVVSLKTKKAVNSQPFFYKEWLTLGGLIFYIVLYISFADGFISRIILPSITGNEIALYFLEMLKQVIFYFLVPFLIYRSLYGYTLREAGLHIPLKSIFSWQNVLTFFVLAGLVILFQYLFNEELELLWEGEIEGRTLVTAVPVLFILLLLKTGLAYGFFFRSLLQSRLSIGLNSKFGGMVVSLLIFGLAHLPLLMREGISGTHVMMPNAGFLTLLGMSIGILSITALFIAIVWRRSKNLWLVMGLYAVLDLLPNLHHFLQLWL